MFRCVTYRKTMNPKDLSDTLALATEGRGVDTFEAHGDVDSGKILFVLKLNDKKVETLFSVFGPAPIDQVLDITNNCVSNTEQGYNVSRVSFTPISSMTRAVAVIMASKLETDQSAKPKKASRHSKKIKETEQTKNEDVTVQRSEES